MNLLAIDSTTEQASVGISYQGRVYVKQQLGFRSHAQYLLELINTLLLEADISLSQLNGIAYTSGPGSFTGLRIACSIAKGLATAVGIPLYPINALSNIAYTAAKQHLSSSMQHATSDMPGISNESATPDVLAVIDARMNQLYWAHYSFSEAIHTSATHPVFVNDANNILFDSHRPLILAGVEYEAYMNTLPENVTRNIVKTYSIYPDAKAMLRIANTTAISPVTPEAATLTYVRNKVT